MSTRLSLTQRKAMDLAQDTGKLERRVGGYWTPPSEPKWPYEYPPTGNTRWVGTRTIVALVRMGLLEQKWSHEVTLPPEAPAGSEEP